MTAEKSGWPFKTHCGSSNVRYAFSRPDIGYDVAPARGPPLWDDFDAHVGEGVAAEPDWDLAAQPAPDFEVDQRINW